MARNLSEKFEQNEPFYIAMIEKADKYRVENELSKRITQLMLDSERLNDLNNPFVVDDIISNWLMRNYNLRGLLQNMTHSDINAISMQGLSGNIAFFVKNSLIKNKESFECAQNVEFRLVYINRVIDFLVYKYNKEVFDNAILDENNKGVREALSELLRELFSHESYSLVLRSFSEREINAINFNYKIFQENAQSVSRAQNYEALDWLIKEILVDIRKKI